MSFLNSVLSSINNGKAPITVPQVRSAKPDQESSGSAAASASAKRKASSELTGPSDKLSKASFPPSGKDASSSSRLRQPNPAAAATPQRPPPAAAAVAAASKASHKKGSFQEIMARANAAAQVGQLTHKAKSKAQLSTKKELALQKQTAQQHKKAPHASKNASLAKQSAREAVAASRSSGKMVKGAKPGDQGSAKKRPLPSFQGTARPKAPVSGYQGTAKANNENPRRREYDSEPDRSGSASKRHQKRSYSDAGSESQDESEDGYTYASSDYSDMDAGFDDVDEEEAAAEKQAKKEDVWEQRRLDELARQKALRKKRAQEEMDREKNRKR